MDVFIYTSVVIITVLAFIGFFILAVANKEDKDLCLIPFGGALGMTVILVVVLALARIEHANNVPEPEPTAIDVYRGRTTLQVTYKDSVPVDTMVVFKEVNK